MSSRRSALRMPIAFPSANGDDAALPGVPVKLGESIAHVRHGSVVIAAITSCTNTSNPSVMLGAGLLAKKAVERGLDVAPYVKTSLAPGSQVVTRYLDQSGLTGLPRSARLPHGRLRLHDVHRQLRSAARARSPRRSTTTISSSRPCCPATATSRAASTSRYAPPSWLRRRSWWPMHWPARSTSTLPRIRSVSIRTASRSTWPISGRPATRSRTSSPIT